MSYLISQLRLIFGVLTFSATPEQLDRLGWKSLLMGLPIVWLVGFGRWWDEPRDISLLHRSGLGSVVYVLCLSVLLFLVAAPLSTRRIDLIKLIAFIAYTAPPAALYALPVEMWVDRETAVGLNILFLSIVSIYRVGLLVWFYHQGLEMRPWHAWVAGFLPITGIAVGLTFSGFAERIIEIMGGLRDQSAATEAYGTVAMISCASIYLAPFLLIAWGVAVAQAARDRNDDQPVRHDEIPL